MSLRDPRRAPIRTRSQKPSSTRDRTLQSLDNADETDLDRSARLKQDRPPTSHGPRTITAPPNPEKWAVKDTSVIIASAFNQAVNDMPPSNPNSAWASGSRTGPTVPRSTSVEYEQTAQSLSTRRLAPPRSNVGRKPPSKQASVRHVPDSEDEGDSPEHSRAKSPFDSVVEAARRLAPTTFFLRQRSQEPDQPSTNGNHVNGSYNYSAEEREFQAAQNADSASRQISAAHKRGRISLDNKAYRPSKSDLEDSDGDLDDDGKKARRKKKNRKEPVGGPLTTLPVTSYDKKKKKKKSRKSGTAGGENEEDSGSDEHSDQNSAPQRASVGGSAPPSRIGYSSHPPPTSYDTSGADADASMDIETGLQSIPEVEEAALPQRKRSKSVERQPKPFSFGGALGKVFYGIFYTVSSMISLVWRSASALLYMCGRMLGAVFEAVLMGPLRWFSRAKSGHLPSLSRYIVVACTIYAAWYILRDSTIPWARFRPFAGGPYQPSNIPPANIAELAARLQQLEAAFTKISDDTVRSKTRYESAAKEGNELAGKLDKIESRLVQESLRTAEVEKQAMMNTNKGLEAIKQEMEILHVQMQTQQQQQSHVSTELIDEAAKAKLEALEERVGSVEGSVRQALETTKNVGKGGVGSLWRSMLGSGGSHAELMIKSSDGQDVTALLAQIVDAQVNKYAKDTLARPDFALHSGGAMIIPSLTSPTFEVKPQTLRGQLVGFVTGNGYAIGRPPITALHHELHNGHCWPFARSEGQLGVVLAAPTYITDVTIDHVAKEVAFDMRSAPKDMELWGMVEGRENIARVKAWQAAKAQLRKEALARGEELDENLKEIPYPRTLPKSPQYIRVAKFTYDIHGQHNVQSFQVSQEIRDLGVDFGIVVLRVKSNWGREDFTCLYRLRVHGQRMGETPLPYPEDEIA